MPLTKYKIKRNQEGDLHPEETLIDTLSDHSVVEKPIGHRVFGVVYSIVFLFCLVILFKALNIQLLNGDKYYLIAQKSASLRYLGPGFRGVIYDANNQPLVENLPIFDLIGVHADLPQSADEVKFAINTIAPIISISPEELEKIFEANEDISSFVIKSGLSKEEVAKMEAASPKGLYVVANAQRHYIDSRAVASVVGYTAKVSEADIKNDPYYLLTDRVGRFGLEQYYEEYLRGEHRSIDLKYNRRANYQTDALPGADLFLHIDKEAQAKLYEIMTRVLNSAGLKRGAAIVQDPRTGAIISLVSMPSFDSNIFENNSDQVNTEKINQVLTDNNRPLFNRVVSGRYSPGSTIKPLLAMAGLKEGVVTPATIVNATGSITVKSIYDPTVSYTFKDWKVHGLTDIKKAIADSVDVYFYALGGGYGNIKGLGAEKIISYFKQALIDAMTKIDLPGEATGFVPTEEWKQATKNQSWFIGDTYNISIGQGDLLVTPLWLNAYVSAIANGGSIMKPLLMKEIKNSDGRIIIENKPEELAKLPFDSNTMAIVKAGMRQTVTDGTAQMLQGLPIEVAAKTGTAQVTGKNLNSLFIVYGPYDNPTIAMTVLIENVQSQGLAMQVARDFFLWYLSTYPLSK